MQNQPAKTNSPNADSTVERIIDAAEQLFADNSYEGTTLRQIAQQVGIKEPSIYAHFANKEAVYGAVIDRALQPFLLEIGGWIGSDLTLRDLYEMPRKILALHAQHPYAARILHREFCNPLDRISPKIMEWLDRIVQQSGVLLANLPSRDGKPLDKSQVVIQIITLTNMTLGFFATQGMQMKLMGQDYDRERMFEEHVQLVAKIFRGLVV